VTSEPQPGATQPGATRYHTTIDPTKLDSSQAHLIDLTGERKRVLEVGAATGYVSKALKDRGCDVTAIEIDDEAAEIASKHCDRMIVGNVETLDFAEAFGDQRFEVAIFGDVLEHLVDPKGVLERLKEYLTPDGVVLASIPNVTHGAVRLSLLAGHFRYTDMGLLDRTHLRFFDRDGVHSLFADAGYGITEWRRVELPILGTEIELSLDQIPTHVVQAVESAPDAKTYQFVVRAAPGAPDAVDEVHAAASPDALELIEAKIEDAELLVAEAVAQAEQADAATQEARDQAAHAMRNYSSLLESRAIRGTAPIRTTFNIFRRLVGRETLPAPVQAHVDQVYYPRDDSKLCVVGWCWSNTFRVPRLSLLVGDEKVASWRPEKRRPDLARHLGFQNDVIGFEVEVPVPGLSDEAEVSVVVDRPASVLLTRALAGDLARARDHFAGRAEAVYLDPSIATRPPLEPRRGLASRRPPGASVYEDWVEENLTSDERLAEMKEENAALGYRPLVSIVMPVYNTPPKYLSLAIESVRNQVYENWELCIADDCSTRSQTRRVLDQLAGDDRIKVARLADNRGIALASNAAIELATGEFVGLLDHDDLLRPGALLEVVKLLNERPELDYFFSDEDKSDENGRLFNPFFKPGWSPDFLMSNNYVTHFSVYRRTLLDEIGRFREGYDGSQDFDLVLRATEKTKNIAHIAWPIYSWRAFAGSAALSASFKPAAWDAGKRALEDALVRRGLEGTVEPGLNMGQYRVRYAIKGTPKIAIIIPTRDHAHLLSRCLDTVRRLSTWPHYEILVVDHDSQDPEALKLLEDDDLQVLKYRGRFNFSRMCNLGAERMSHCDYFLFLNDDTEVISPDWMEAMLEHAQRPEVGAVGARLLFPDGSPQHEGIVCETGPYNIDYRTGRGPLYLSFGLAIRNMAAVTGACMLIRKDVFAEIGRFSEELDVAYNDVDLCLKALERGYLNVYTPYAQLYHLEGSSRGKLHPTRNTALFEEHWSRGDARRDPYYNPRLTVRPPFALSNVRRV
jgi:GT2 family glycosyltransferase/2-polyprenyl-3-methyl-5-hydroxy-6-metoxy-1,4-benzoquinol methylase